jgi:protease I
VSNWRETHDTFPVDTVVTGTSAADYAALALPGGVGNPDTLRLNTDAVGFVRHFFDAGEPVGAICHALWLLVEADVVRGRTVTSWPSLRTDLVNAGADWVDEEVVVDGHLVTSRKPDDLPAFNPRIVDLFASATAEG